MPQCFRCQRDLPWSFTITVGGAESTDAWHMENPAPNAAAGIGGSPPMVPVCNKCSPMWIVPKCEHETWMTFDMLPAAYNCAQCHVQGILLADGRIVAVDSPEGLAHQVPDRFPDRPGH